MSSLCPPHVAGVDARARGIVFRSVAFVACMASAAPALSQPSRTAPPTSQSARESEPPARHRGEQQDSTEGVGVVLLGPALLDFSSLNARLRANGYEELAPTSMLIGAEGVGVFTNGFVVGARVAGILPPSGGGPDDIQTRFGGGFGTLDLGYALVRTTPLLLTLTAGGGWYVVSLDVSDNQSAPFDEVLVNSRRSASLSRGGILGGLTLSMDWRIGPSDRHGRTFLTLGARVGGLYGPPIGEWSLASGAKAGSEPKLGLRGGFVVLALGFGGG